MIEVSLTCFYTVKRLASSIHTIHRPMVRSQRVSIPNAFKPSVSQKEGTDLEDTSSEELENDFEDTPRVGGMVPSQFMEDPTAEVESGHEQEQGASLATIRLHRRMHLAEKLKQVFDIEDIHEVLTGMQLLV